MSAEIEGLLADLLNAQQAGGKPQVQSGLGLLADWATDHPAHAGDLLSALLRRLPDIVGIMVRQNLAVEIHKETYAPTGSYHPVLQAIRVEVYWDGALCQTSRITV